MKRSKHSLSHYKLATFDMGELVPVSCFEALPGDSIRMSTSALLRLSPLVTPVMHPVQVRIHHWFVPYRIIEADTFDWESFITGGSDGMDAQTFPMFTNLEVQEGSPADYMGVPPGVGRTYAQMPIRAYYQIFNEFYRDQDLQAEVVTNGNETQELLKVAWEKDQFTAARPWVQKGPDITLPLGATAPVIGEGGAPTFDGGGVTNAALGMAAATNNLSLPGAVGADPSIIWNDPQLIADLSAATAVSVNDVRLAFALQRYQEARAQYGSRFTEYLRYLGVRSSDARLQRPEYLGGGRATISFSEVLRTGNTDADVSDFPIGEMAGHGISALRTRSWVRFFEEHGVVMSLASVRPRTMYVNGLNKQWTRLTKEEFWQKELELIGQEEVLNREIYADDSVPTEVFGYQDRYYSYRRIPSTVSGEFRTTRSDWHLGRVFAGDVALNSSFIECAPTKRVFAEQTGDALIGMFSHSIQARRLLGNRTIGRIM